MQKAEIQSWISSGKDYSDGIRILKKYAPGAALIRILETGEDSFNRKKLNLELQQILDSLPEEKKVKVLEPIVHEDSPKPIPAKLLRLITEQKTLYAEVNHLHSCSSSYPEGQGLKELCFEILGKWDRIDEIWAIRDHYTESGTMPPDAADLLEEKYNDPIFLKQTQANLRSNLSKFPAKEKKAAGDSKRLAELADRKTQYLKELKVVDEKLKAFGGKK